MLLAELDEMAMPKLVYVPSVVILLWEMMLELELDMR